jgi:hypothetical protein
MNKSKNHILLLLKKEVLRKLQSNKNVSQTAREFCVSRAMV